MDWLGPTQRERLLRRLAGGAAATALLSTGLAWLGRSGDARDGLPLLLAVVAAGTACTALTWPLEKYVPARWPFLRYLLVGTAAGACTALAFGWGQQLVALVVVVAAPLGAMGGAVGVAVARWSPPRVLVPLLAVALVTVGATLAMSYGQSRPPAPGSYLVITDPGRTTTSRALAEDVARALAGSTDPISDRALSDVAGEVGPTGEGSSLEVGYERTGPDRRITVDVNGDRSCVVATPDAVEVQDGSCAE